MKRAPKVAQATEPSEGLQIEVRLTDGSSVVCPWSGDSMYTVPRAFPKLAIANPPSSPACAPISAGTICTVMLPRHEASATGRFMSDLFVAEQKRALRSVAG